MMEDARLNVPVVRGASIDNVHVDEIAERGGEYTRYHPQKEDPATKPIRHVLRTCYETTAHDPRDEDDQESWFPPIAR